ncbi:MAG TPA: DM13 domain-containing protein [Nitrososphaera sp.]
MGVNEDMTPAMISNQTAATTNTRLAGTFIGVNDGIHNAAGMARVIKLARAENSSILRLENFKSTNGPDLYDYLSADSHHASDYVSLGRLKGNMGNQNYEIPDGTDLSKYHVVLIWCRAFSVLSESTELNATC